MHSVGAGDDYFAIWFEDADTANFDVFIDRGVIEDELTGEGETSGRLHPNAADDFTNTRAVVLVAHETVTKFVNGGLLRRVGCGLRIGAWHRSRACGILSEQARRCHQQEKQNRNQALGATYWQMHGTED